MSLVTLVEQSCCDTNAVFSKESASIPKSEIPGTGSKSCEAIPLSVFMIFTTSSDSFVPKVLYMQYFTPSFSKVRFPP